MNNKGQINSQELKMQDLIGKYLQSYSSKESKEGGKHLDEDTLTAFVEGNLTERESVPTLSHLVNCSFCRHVTAELVKLDMAFNNETVAIPATLHKSEPTSVSDVLSNLLSRIFGTSDSAVLAHQEPEETEEENQENQENKENKENKENQ